MLAGLVLAGALCAGTTGQAGAHAELIARSPAANSVLNTAPREITLTFSERVLASLSQVVVDDPAGQRADSGQSAVHGGGLVLQATLLRNLQPGPYSVVWTAVSADDGHITQGTYTFVVGQGGTGIVVPGGGATGLPAGIAPLLGLTRILIEWLSLLGTALWVGVPLYLWGVLRPALRRQRRPAELDQETWHAIGDSTTGHATSLIAAGAGLTLLSTVAALLLQAASLALATGSSALDALTSQIAGSHYGLIWLAREMVLVVVFALGIRPVERLVPAQALVVSGRGAAGETSRGQHGAWRPNSTSGQDVRWLTTIGVVYLALLALDGHAAAVVHLLPLSLAIDWLHLLATAVWLGGTVGTASALVPALRSLPPRARAAGLAALLPAFSPWALAAVGAMVVTGTGNAVLRSTDLSAWVGSTYGRALILKIALFLIMIAVSRYHAFVLRPRLSHLLTTREEDTRLHGTCLALERLVSVNPYLAAGVLLCVAVMTSSPPPV